MKETCPCCQKVFEFSLNESSMGNVVSCTHCQSTLKWADNSSLEVIYNSNLGEETKTHLQQETSQPHTSSSSLQNPESANMKQYRTEDSQNSSPLAETPIFQDDKEQQHIQDASNTHSHFKESNSLSLEQPQEPTQKENALSPPESSQYAEGTSPVNHERSPKKQNFSDVEDFGNTEASSEKGFLRYDLCIENIDSSDLEEEIFHILEDPRFNWNAKEILSAQKDSILTIKNLNPVKMFRLVSDLSRLPINLSWKQYTALESNSSEDFPQNEEQESV